MSFRHWRSTLPGLCLLLATTCTHQENDTFNWMLSECLECTSQEEQAQCDDGLDNDEDGLFDCDDIDCEGIGCCGRQGDESTDEFCNDGCDNDGDGYSDCLDHSCSKSSTVTVCKSAVQEDEDTPETCSDGIDNDWNGHFDCDDWSCSQSDKVSFCEGNDTTCDDGVDNDGDGFVDCKDWSCQTDNITVCK
jgi:hypothetical protein